MAWYRNVRPDELIDQGDVLRSFPVASFPVSTEGAPDKASDEKAKTKVSIRRTDAIVLTQSCDIAQSKTSHIVLCPIIDVQIYKSEWIASKEKGGKTPNQKDADNFVSQISKGYVANKCIISADAASPPLLTAHVVDFSFVYSALLEDVLKHLKTPDHRQLRLISPYREYVSQAFARCYMRVALPAPAVGF